MAFPVAGGAIKILDTGKPSVVAIGSQENAFSCCFSYGTRSIRMQFTLLQKNKLLRGQRVWYYPDYYHLSNTSQLDKMDGILY